MSSNYAFRSAGNTLCLDVTNTSTASPLQALGDTGNPQSGSYLVSNSSSTVGCWLIATQYAASAVAVIPTTGQNKLGVYLQPGSSQVLTFTPGCYFAAITASSTCTIYITPGEGI
jgi:hypothetical protein